MKIRVTLALLALATPLLAVWKRHPDGSYRSLRDAGNVCPAPGR